MKILNLYSLSSAENETFGLSSDGKPENSVIKFITDFDYMRKIILHLHEPKRFFWGLKFQNYIKNGGQKQSSDVDRWCFVAL